MSQRNIPRSDAGAAAWMRTFVNGISKRPALYRVDSEALTELVDVVQAFRDTLAKATWPTTRTTVVVAQKNERRVAAERVCRMHYAMIRALPDLSKKDLIDIGIRPRKLTRTPSQAPTAAPILFVDTYNTSHRIRWTGEVAKRGKPPGCAMLQLFVSLSDAEAARTTGLRLLNVYTSNEVTLRQDKFESPLSQLVAEQGVGHLQAEGTKGKMATFVGRWAGPRGQAGPWSRPVSVRIAA